MIKIRNNSIIRNSISLGTMTGVHFMFVEDKAQLHFTCTSRTALRVNQAYSRVTERGNFSVSMADIKYGSALIFTDQFDDDVLDMLVTIPDLEIKHTGKMVMRNSVTIESGWVDLESAAFITLDGTGFAAGFGPGSGTSDSSGATGASHGGAGGHLDSGWTG